MEVSKGMNVLDGADDNVADACKFMHDRGDYKTGWQLDKDWDEQEKSKADDRKSGSKRMLKMFCIVFYITFYSQNKKKLLQRMMVCLLHVLFVENLLPILW
jgi:hypothetical protein